MTQVSATTSTPTHVLFAYLANKRASAKTDDPVYDGNHQVALVTFAEDLLQEINNKAENDIKVYEADKRPLTEKWLSRNILAKAYAAYCLQTLRKRPNGFIEISTLSGSIRDDKLFHEALNLLIDTGHIEQQYDPMNSKPVIVSAKVTDKGKQYLKIDGNKSEE